MELVPGKLYFSLSVTWNEKKAAFPSSVICLDENFEHSAVKKHFGPPTLRTVWKQCSWLDEKIRKDSLTLLTNSQNDNLSIEQRTLSSFIVAAYAVLRLDWLAENANRLLLTSIPAKLAYFRDFHGDSAYKLTIADCLRALQFGCKKYGWFNSLELLRFPIAANSQLDMDWIIPGKLLAFKDPTTNRDQDCRGVSRPVIRELRRLSVKSVVRLNSYDHLANFEYYGSSYHPIDLEREGFEVFEIPFKDVGIPTDKQVKLFIDLCEKSDRPLAVHCHAGLGRTATMIGCYMIKKYEFDSRSTCAWMKMCRRGSVMGPQHFFLDKYELQWKNISKGQEKLEACLDVTKKTKSGPVEKKSLPTDSPLSETLLPEKPRLARPPQKNNIIHIVPPKNKDSFAVGSMHKYRPSVPASTTSKVESLPSKRKLGIAVQPEKTMQKSKTSSKKSSSGMSSNHTSSAARSTVATPDSKTAPSTPAKALNSNVCQRAIKTGISTVDQPQTKRPRREKTETFTTVRPKVFHLNVDEVSILTAPKSRSKLRSMHQSGTKSHHDALVRSSGGSSVQDEQLVGSNSWTQGASRARQWGGHVIGKLVHDSTSRLQSFINNIYAREVQ